MKYKVMIADDQFVARQLFELYVKSSDNYEVAVSVDTAAMVENLLETVTVDLIIMDVLMNDGSNGLVAAEKIKKMYPEIKIIVVTSMAEVSWMERAKKAGIEGFWYKEASGEDILSVMDAVMAGETVYPDIQPRVRVGMADSNIGIPFKVNGGSKLTRVYCTFQVRFIITKQLLFYNCKIFAVFLFLFRFRHSFFD